MDVSPLITNACKDEDVALLLLLPMMPFIGDKLSHFEQDINDLRRKYEMSENPKADEKKKQRKTFCLIVEY